MHTRLVLDGLQCFSGGCESWSIRRVAISASCRLCFLLFILMSVSLLHASLRLARTRCFGLSNHQTVLRRHEKTTLLLKGSRRRVYGFLSDLSRESAVNVTVASKSLGQRWTERCTQFSEVLMRTLFLHDCQSYVNYSIAHYGCPGDKRGKEVWGGVLVRVAG